MDAKITRRVVLGTVITALAAGPFIMRSLHRKKHLPDIGRAKMKRQWDALLQEVTPDVKPMGSQQPVLCQLMPEVGEFPYTILYPVYNDLSEWPQETPDLFHCRSGQFSTKMIGGETVLTGKDTESVVVSPKGSQPFPLETWIMAMRNNIFVPMEFADDRLSELDWNRDSDQFSQLMSLYAGLASDAPGRALTVGDTWTVGGLLGGEFVGSVTRHYMGKFAINGRPVFQVNTKQDVGFADLMALAEDTLPRVKNKSLRDKINNEMEPMRKMQGRIIAENTSYFDVDTGVLIFRKFEKSIFQSDRLSPVSLERSFTVVKV